MDVQIFLYRFVSESNITKKGSPKTPFVSTAGGNTINATYLLKPRKVLTILFVGEIIFILFDK